MNIYLIISESFRLVDEKIATIINNSENVVSYDLNNYLLEDLITEAGYISIFDEQKYIIAKNADFFGSNKLKESDTNILCNYLNNPNDKTTLIFTTSKKVDDRKKITKIVRNNYNVIDIPKLSEYEMNKKIAAIMKKKGYNIDYESIQYLIKNSLNNYDIIYNEIEKIVLYYGDNKTVKIGDLKLLISHSLDDNIFKLINAIVDKNYQAMFKTYEELKIFKVEPIAIISLLAKEYRNIYLVKTCKNYSNIELMKLMGVQNWQFAKYEKISYDYSIKELKNYIKLLYKMDLNIKKGKIDKYLAIELFMLDL